MFTAEQFRAKAAESDESIRNTDVPSEIRRFQRSRQAFLELAQNEDWLADNLDKVIRPEDIPPQRRDAPEKPAVSGTGAEEHVLRCLGAAVIIQWNAIPTKLQRALFDAAGSAGGLLQTAALRGQIARFLHDRKDDESFAGVAGSNTTKG